MKSLDAWITGHLGDDLDACCPECNCGIEHHCQRCGTCIETDYQTHNYCEKCKGLFKDESDS